ncbi:MAG: copper-binding protein [bacterium]|nr:copper-binding protein [Candidatus Kapabacteria bacterium]
MKHTILTFAFAAAIAFGTSACGNDEYGDDAAQSVDSASQSPAVDNNNGAAPAPAADAAGGVKEYTFHGTVTKVDAATQMITIDHEDIGDYMKAMTMPFKVADAALLDQVKVGDATHFTLRVSGDQALITKIQKDHEEGGDH